MSLTWLQHSESSLVETLHFGALREVWYGVRVLLWRFGILLWSSDSVALEILVDSLVDDVLVYIVYQSLLIIVPLPSATSWNNLMANNLLL